jgi:hypothetical protein
MAVATLPAIASRKQRRAWIALMLALLLGLLSLAAVPEMKVEWRNQALGGTGAALWV